MSHSAPGGRFLFAALVSAVCTWAGCNCGPGPTDSADAGGPDAGEPGPVDGGLHDAGADDGGPSDAGAADGGPSDGGPSDGGPSDAGLGDAGMRDGGPSDGGPSDAGMRDGGAPDAGHDAGAPDAGPTHVDIYIDNFCHTSTVPNQVTAALNSNLRLQFHNNSVDYTADVWSSRGYGYLDLAMGGLWNDPIPHCGGPNPYTESFDVSINGGGSSACPSVRLDIHCQ